MAQREVAPGDVLIYNPLDFPSFVKSALKTVRPRAVVLVESEIWPLFIRAAKKMSVPLFLVNARVSDRSAPRYRAARWIFKDVFGCFSAIFAQSRLDRRRLADAARRAAPEKEAQLREWVGGGRILLGGSTWPGEDEVLLDAYAKLRERDASLKLVIAPRHFEKADAIETNILKAGFRCIRRSRADVSAADGSGAVWLADTTGELMAFYGIADVVFVGKSLCAHGSQNMIEPCLCAKPTLVGPYTENFRPVMDELLADNAIIQVKDASELLRRLEDALFADDGLGQRAAAAVEARRGVVAGCVETIRDAVR